jgi:hypothetical protein
MKIEREKKKEKKSVTRLDSTRRLDSTHSQILHYTRRFLREDLDDSIRFDWISFFSCHETITNSNTKHETRNTKQTTTKADPPQKRDT